MLGIRWSQDVLWLCTVLWSAGKLTKRALLFYLQIAVKICQTTVLCRQFLALMSLSEFYREKLSFVAISFYALSLLFAGSCRLSEFTLAGPLHCRGPQGKISIKKLFFRSESAKYFTHADNRIGGRYKKAMYVEYTDDTFTTKANRTPSQMHLGFLGPVIRAEVGDEIKVLFKNQVIAFAINVWKVFTMIWIFSMVEKKTKSKIHTTS